MTSASPAGTPPVAWGRAGLHVSPIGLGCSRLGSALAGLSRAEALHLVQHALDRDVRLFDTADIYGQGNSERLLGAAIGRRRPEVVLVSKAGQRFTPAQRLAAAFKTPIRALISRVPMLHTAVKAQRARSLPRDYSPGHIQRALEGSLRRLGTDWLDVFLLHSPDATDVREGRCFDLLDRLREQGKIRHWGVSCDDLATAEAALRVPGVAVLQIPLLLAEAAPELLAQATRLKTALQVREVFAGAAEPLIPSNWRGQRIAAALAIPNASALIGTTRRAHLDEALDAQPGLSQPAALERLAP